MWPGLHEVNALTWALVSDAKMKEQLETFVRTAALARAADVRVQRPRPAAWYPAGQWRQRQPWPVTELFSGLSGCILCSRLS